MNEQPEDQEFAAFLSGKSALKRPYKKLGREQPPAEVDQRILAEAREAAGKHRREYGPRGGWLKPAALAATVLLSFTIVMQFVDITPVSDESVVPPAVSEPEAFAQEMRAPETKLMRAPVAPSSGAEEIVVTARKRVETVDDGPAAAVTLQSIEMLAERDQAFAIIAAYVAATDSGGVRVDFMEKRSADFAALAESNTDDLKVIEEQALLAEVPALADAPALANEMATALPADADLDPDSMLREIARLDAEQKRDQAKDLLDNFLLRYPDHPVSIKILAANEAP